MRKLGFLISIGLLLVTGLAQAGPEEDRSAIVKYFEQRFPTLEPADFANGAYSLDDDAREQWQEIEEFPPYEFALDRGRALFETPFANGKSYADCFASGGLGISQNYPLFNTETGQVVTMELAINQCREANGEAPLPWLEGPLAEISAYMAYTSRGKPVSISIPGDPRALAAYEDGKRYYYSRRGQLNFSCKGCHVQNAGMMIRADRLSPALGQTTHWPVHRGAWDDMGTLHRRYQECNRQVREMPLAAQSETYRNLEFFMRYMDSGLPSNGPSYRK